MGTASPPDFVASFRLGSGVALELSTPVKAPFDSRFLSDSFFVLFSRTMVGMSSGGCGCAFAALESGFRGDRTAGDVVVFDKGALLWDRRHRGWENGRRGRRGRSSS